MKLISLAILLSAFVAGAHGEPAVIDGIEANSVELLVDSAGNGFAVARECAACPIRVAVDASTTFLIRNRTVTLDQARANSGKGATLIYDRRNSKAIRIQW